MEKPNLNYIDELSAGNEDFRKFLIHTIQTEFPVEIAKYYKNEQQGLLQEMANDVHKLKHKLGILGFVEGYQLAMDYDEELRNGIQNKKEAFSKILKSATTFITTI